ncbi:unnamed protein product [Heterobilharzia americana]|nr:unnamed protein product [Heterobilharzia americana]
MCSYILVRSNHACQSCDFVSELRRSELMHLWCSCFASHQCFLQNNIHYYMPRKTTCKAILDKILDLLLNPQNLNIVKCFNYTQNEDEHVINYDVAGISLYDVIRYSPGRLQNCNTLLFIVFQVIHTVKQLHEMGLPHCGITLHNVFIDENFNTFLGFPNTVDFFSKAEINGCRKDERIPDIGLPACNDSKLSKTTTDWVLHKVSNYDYLMYLNKLAGRHKGEDQLDANFKASLYNHVISKRPSWPLGNCISEDFDSVNHQQDFVSFYDEPATCGLNNSNDNLLFSNTDENINSGESFSFKGNRNLDIRQHNTNLIFSPHHLLDIMPDLAYYTYMARKTPLSVLTQFVRPVYQPQEFPTSIARLYESTPDECIPEFFTDPSVFSSIHSDMPDLGLPSWCSTPEEFITYHAKLLESDEVSKSLHHWIDLNFGYKLLGPAALDAKNVHLELSGDQTTSRCSGVVCLFHTPHPQRICNKTLSTYFGASLPDILPKNSKVVTPRNYSVDKDMKILHPVNKVFSEKDSCTSTTTTKQIKSVSSSKKTNQNRKVSSNDGTSSSENKIWLSDDYNPLELINLYQNLCRFLSVETHIQDLEELEAIRLCKLDKYDTGFNNLFKIDLDSFGCLIVELSLYSVVNYTEVNLWNHEERITFARQHARLHWDKIPNCLHDAVNIILRPFDQNLVGENFHKRFLPTADILLHLICEFPPYLYDLQYIRDWLLHIAHPHRPFQSESTSNYSPKTHLFSAFFPVNQQCTLYNTSDVSTVNIPIDITRILYPQIQTAVYTNPIWFLNILNSSKILEHFSTVGGKELVQSHLLPLIVYLYKPEQLKRMSNDVSSGIPLALLYSRRFLRRLLAYFNVNIFMVHILPYITLGLIGGSSEALIDENTIWYQRSHTGLTNDVNSNALDNEPHEFVHNVDLNEEQSFPCSQSKNITTSYELLYDKQDILNVDEIGIDLRSFINGEEFQLFKDAKGSSELTCQNFDDEECDDTTNRRSLTNCLSDEVTTRSDSPSSTSQTSKSSEIIHDGSRGDKHTNKEGKKVTTPDVTSVCTNATSNSSNCAYISSIPPITAAMDSLNWFAKRVGPVMTDKYIVKYLLTTLTLCYEGKSQLSVNSANSSEKCLLFPSQVNNLSLVGDRSALSVLRCLEQLVQIYGVSFVLDVYLPFVVKTITSITASISSGTSYSNTLINTNYSTDVTEGSNKTSVAILSVRWSYRTLARLVASLTLLYQIIIYLPDNELVEQLQESVIQDALIKAVKMSSRFDISFPGTVIGRRAILYKFIDTVFIIGLRVGFELTRTQLTSVFQVFFALFDRVINTTLTKNILSSNNYSVDNQCYQVVFSDAELTEDFSQHSNITGIFAELVETFNCDLARLAYISFCHLAGGTYIDDCLYNAKAIQKLINESVISKSNSTLANDMMTESSTFDNDNERPGSLLNRKKLDFEATLFANSTLCGDNSYHLRGVWRQIVRDVIDTKSHSSPPYQYHGIQVATFTGHASKINRITCLDTENCFMTASRDKTVQLWSIASTYNPGHYSLSVNQKCKIRLQLVARLVYRAHKKSVLAAYYLEPYRLVASVDGSLLFWDPCTGQTVRSHSQYENSGWQNLTAMECSTVPYGAVICSDHLGFIHLIDPRVRCLGQTSSLHFNSGASLASSLLNKERSKVEIPTSDSSKLLTNSQNFDFKLTPYGRSTLDLCITKIMMSLIEQLQPNVNQLNNPSNNLLTNTNSSTSLLNMNANMAGLLNRLSVSQNGYYLLCGFTTGIITALDLRMGQVIHIWRGYQDAVVDIVSHNSNGFISCNDRSLSFTYPVTTSNFSENSLLNSYCKLNTLTYIMQNSSIIFKSEIVNIPKIQNITCLTMYKENPIFCANPLPSSHSLPNTSRFPYFGVVNNLTGSINELSSNGNISSSVSKSLLRNESIVNSSISSSSVLSSISQSYNNNSNNNNSGTVLGTYLQPSLSNNLTSTYYTLGRIPSNLLRGTVTSIISLSESNLLLVGSDTGALSLLY